MLALNADTDTDPYKIFPRQKSLADVLAVKRSPLKKITIKRGRAERNRAMLECIHRTKDLQKCTSASEHKFRVLTSEGTPYAQKTFPHARKAPPQ